MKKIGYFIALILEIVLFAGAYTFNYFTRRKIGMSRYVGFLNRQIEEAVSIQTIIYAGAALTAVLFIAAGVVYWSKRKELKKIQIFMMGMSVLTTVFGIYYALINNTRTARAYYVVSVLILAAGIIQLVKTIVGCRIKKS